MGRIGATLSGFELKLLHQLQRNRTAVALSSLRLASGQQRTAPRDDPSGWIAAAQLRSELATVTAALGNVSAASSLVSQAQLAVDQIRTQLNTIRTKALEDQDQGLSASARAANQAAIDTAVAEINRLVSSSVGGRRLLDGSADFHYAGVSTAQVAEITAHSLGDAGSLTLSGQVTTAAQQAQLVHTEGTGLITNNATFTLTGDRGSAVLSVTAGESLATVASRVNLESHLTGVTASVSGNDLRLTSLEAGSRADVAVTVTSGTFAVTGGDASGIARGVDAVAEINGRTLTGDGQRFEVQENRGQVTIEFQAGFSGALAPITVSGTGLRFSLSTDPGRLAVLALPGLQASRLGGLSGRLDQLTTGGALAGLGANAPQAVRVVDEALARLTRVEGRLDGFANATITASSGLLADLESELVEAIDTVDGVDEDEETVVQAKHQQLVDHAVASLAVLTAQRSSLVELVRHLAGLD
jgi:flagellin-like hook-associated protein FlgL